MPLAGSGQLGKRKVSCQLARLRRIRTRGHRARHDEPGIAKRRSRKAAPQRTMSANANLASETDSRGRKPRVSLFIATACGLGYLPKAPGTWGSLAGVWIYFLIGARLPAASTSNWISIGAFNLRVQLSTAIAVAIALAVLGVWTSHRVARFSATKDPQFVVIDEVSGQMLTYVLALAPANWKYLLLGLILFRVFDIWK